MLLNFSLSAATSESTSTNNIHSRPIARPWGSGALDFNRVTVGFCDL
jgi:hypothetical protein